LEAAFQIRQEELDFTTAPLEEEYVDLMAVEAVVFSYGEMSIARSTHSKTSSGKRQVATTMLAPAWELTSTSANRG